MTASTVRDRRAGRPPSHPKNRSTGDPSRPNLSSAAARISGVAPLRQDRGEPIAGGDRFEQEECSHADESENCDELRDLSCCGSVHHCCTHASSGRNQSGSNFDAVDIRRADQIGPGVSPEAVRIGRDQFVDGGLVCIRHRLRITGGVGEIEGLVDLRVRIARVVGRTSGPEDLVEVVGVRATEPTDDEVVVTRGHRRSERASFERCDAHSQTVDSLQLCLDQFGGLVQYRLPAVST